MTYAIKDWASTFENRRSRELVSLNYVMFPVSQDSEAYRKLVKTPAGRDAVAVFLALVQIAARCPLRGVLADDRGDITPERVADRLPIPASVVMKAMQLLATKEIGWLVPHDDVPPSTAPPAPTGNHMRADVAPTQRRRSADAAPKDLTRPDQTRKERIGLNQTRAEARCELGAVGAGGPPDGIARAGASGLAGWSGQTRPEMANADTLGGLEGFGRSVSPPESADASRGNVGRNARDALLRRGVGEPALSALARAEGCTAALVDQTWAGVMADPDTKNATRLLVARLALALNVKLPRRRENAGVDLGGGFQGAVERIAKMRGRRATA